MEPIPDYYTILGVASTATVEEIRRAHRRLARMVHPDRNGGSPASVERMKTVNAARDLLSDPAQRFAYDARRSEAVRIREASRRSEPMPEERTRPWVYEEQEATIHARRRRQAHEDAWRASGGQRRAPDMDYAAMRAMAAAEFGRPSPAAGWIGCLATIIGFGMIVSFTLGGILSSHSSPDSGEASLPLTHRPPAPANSSPSGQAHPELCQTFLRYRDVLSASSGSDGTTIIIMMLPGTSLSDRIAVAMQADAAMDGRMHRGIDDHLTSIGVISSRGAEQPITLLPGRQSWGVRVPDQR